MGRHAKVSRGQLVKKKWHAFWFIFFCYSTGPSSHITFCNCTNIVQILYMYLLVACVISSEVAWKRWIPRRTQPVNSPFSTSENRTEKIGALSVSLPVLYCSLFRGRWNPPQGIKWPTIRDCHAVACPCVTTSSSLQPKEKPSKKRVDEVHNYSCTINY